MQLNVIRYTHASMLSFTIDKVWGPDSRQRDVFQDVEPMALSVVDGYNACIFAYGQVRFSFVVFTLIYSY